jgi:hypothetical protein
MALPQIYEGTAEEIAAQLRRSHLKVNLREIVLSDENAHQDDDTVHLDTSLGDLLREADLVIPEAPAPQADSYEIAFGEAVT